MEGRIAGTAAELSPNLDSAVANTELRYQALMPWLGPAERFSRLHLDVFLGPFVTTQDIENVEYI